MPTLRVHNFAISVDGYGAGPSQSLDNPLGVGAPRLHEWVFATRYGRRMIGEEGGEEGIDERFMVAGDTGIGATIMGRNMFGPARGPWPNREGRGWGGAPPAVPPPGVRADAPFTAVFGDAGRDDVQLRHRWDRGGVVAGARCGGTRRATPW